MVSSERFDLRNASVLMRQLLPDTEIMLEVNTHTQEKRQGLSGPRGPIYFRRLFGETLGASETHDQTVLALMKAADDRAGLAALAASMVDQGGKRCVRKFVPVFRFSAPPSIIGTIPRFGCGKAVTTSRRNPAFFALGG